MVEVEGRGSSSMVVAETPALPLAQTHQICSLSLSLSLSHEQVSNEHQKKKKTLKTIWYKRQRVREFFLFLRDLYNDLKEYSRSV